MRLQYVFIDLFGCTDKVYENLGFKNYSNFISVFANLAHSQNKFQSKLIAHEKFVTFFLLFTLIVFIIVIVIVVMSKNGSPILWKIKIVEAITVIQFRK